MDALPIFVRGGCVRSYPYGRSFPKIVAPAVSSSNVPPPPLRPFFDGASSEYKRTLETRDPNEARQRYHPHAVVYVQKLAAARRRLASQQPRSARSMVDAYFDGVDERQLQGMARRMASLEFGAFQHAHGLTDSDPVRAMITTDTAAGTSSRTPSAASRISVASHPL
jgi:phytoene dehydrogenase-like protein